MEKAHIAVAASGAGATQVPMYTAQEAGYFKNHGLTVDINTLASSVANQAVISGTVDIYNGAASMINAHLAGADVLYVGAISDHPQIQLFGKKGMKSIADLKGKVIAVGGSQGTSKDIFIHHSLTDAGLTAGKDVQLLFQPSGPAAVATFEAGNADGALVSPPETTALTNEGYPILIDYPRDGLKLVEPGVIVTRSFFKSSPNTIKAYLMSLYDGVKRAVDDPAYAKQVESKASKITDTKVLDDDYQLGLKLWNRNMAIDQADIQLVLDNIDDPKAKGAKPSEFYDNSLVDAVNKDYAAKLFPNDVK